MSVVMELPAPPKTAIRIGANSLLSLSLWTDGGDPPLRSGPVVAELACNPGSELTREAVETAEVADRHPFCEPKGEYRLAHLMASSFEFVELASDLGPRHRHVGERFGDGNPLCNPRAEGPVG